MPEVKRIVQIATATTVQNGNVVLCLYALDNYGGVYMYAPPTVATEEGWRGLPSVPWDQPPKPRRTIVKDDTPPEPNPGSSEN